MEIKNKRRKKILALIIALIASVAFVGIGFALQYNGQTDMTGNSTEQEYMILSPYSPVSYDGMFSNELYYSTYNIMGNVTYTLVNDTETVLVGGVEEIAVSLGTGTFILEQNNIQADYDISMVDTDGTMTGTYYVGLALSVDNGSYTDWQYLPYVIGTGVTFTGISGDYQYIKIKLLIDSDVQTAGTDLTDNPMDDVTFTFKAEATV